MVAHPAWRRVSNRPNGDECGRVEVEGLSREPQHARSNGGCRPAWRGTPSISEGRLEIRRRAQGPTASAARIAYEGSVDRLPGECLDSVPPIGNGCCRHHPTGSMVGKERHLSVSDPALIFMVGMEWCPARLERTTTRYPQEMMSRANQPFRPPRCVVCRMDGRPGSSGTPYTMPSIHQKSHLRCPQFAGWGSR